MSSAYPIVTEHDLATYDSLFIDGIWRPAADDGRRESVNPATGRPLATVSEATPADVDAAVAAARRAFGDAAWSEVPPAARAKLLWRVAELIEANADQLAQLEMSDQGQPLGIAHHISVEGAAEHFRYFAGWCTKISGATSPVSVPGMLHYTRREPLGVCALITPWNFPLLIASWKLAPALATGNTVVIKPAEQTPLTTIRLVELLSEAGIPDGVVNLLTGGAAVGRALVAHEGVDKVSFTGSTAVGREIVASSAGNLKRVTLELGGKAPSIVLPDADLGTAVAGNLRGAVLNTGQVCAAYTRFFVHRSLYDEFATKIAAAAAGLIVGPGDAATTQVGPLVSRDQLDKVTGYVASANDQGAELLAGGGRLDGALADGYFFAPTVFGAVEDDMTIAREEIFGPVLSILAYDDLDEVIARANDTSYGLAACLWTTDLSSAHRTAAALEAGTVYVNALPVLDPAAPWGGYKASGWGREMGPEAIDAYTQTKGVWVNLA
jgi:acyl-CoA reductase-like NAD-dependent aldehyde dehydrogenase